MSVLHNIIERKKIDVAARMELTAPQNVRRAARPSCRSFADALAKPGRSFILEVKKSSPSRGMIREDFDVRAIAGEYESFADALSVITDAPFFGGRQENITLVRSVTEKPILCKDFILSPYQVYEARCFGADAVLLMLSVLDDDTWSECARAASELAMETLTEVHDEEELERALRLGAKIIGINNRDLKTLNIDLSVTERLTPLIPADKIVVCESGIGCRGDLERLSAGVDAFLVGSRLMQEKDLGRAVRELLFGRVKICGLTRAADADAAYQQGATYGGLIFAAESARQIDERTALEITKAAPLNFVGVFVNSPAQEIAEIANRLSLAAIQLHGDEDSFFISELREQLSTACEIWKAVRVIDNLPDLAEFGCDRLLLDTYDKEARGGTGKQFDWSLLNGRTDREKFIIAGGLNPQNAAAAAAKGCFAIDVNSGIEEAPGKKSREHLGNFFTALRG